MGLMYLINGFPAANGMPHFVFGLAGQVLPFTRWPHTRPSLNVIWEARTFVALTGPILWQG